MNVSGAMPCSWVSTFCLADRGNRNKHRNDPRKSAQGHAALVQTVSYFNTWNILVFNEDADAIFRQWQKRRVHISTQDLRIAARALLYGFSGVTSNARDFARVPDLRVEDWTAAPQK
jgi:tRNA(fMet)-specific endonuclease VapC